jgi:hypothetical protein
MRANGRPQPRHAAPPRRHPVVAGFAGSAVVAASGVAVLAAPAPGTAPASVDTPQLPPLAPAVAHAVTTPPPAAVYTVQPGDTLSSIAQAHGLGSNWEGLWGANPFIDNPDLIQPGWVVRLAAAALTPPMQAELTRLLAPPPPPPAPAPAAPVATVSGTLTVAGFSGFEGCVISRESSGNPDAQNPDSTASGLFGFLDTTWTEVTGLPGPARDYSVATQEAAFSKEYAEDGTAPWRPYDHC